MRHMNRQPDRSHALCLTAAFAAVGMLVATVSAAPQGAAPQAAPPAPQKSPYRIWQGVYTEAQAERGKRVIENRCAHCHAEDLTGGDGPPIVGQGFVRNWGSRYMDRLFKKVRDTMPPGEEEVVTEREKIDAIAFILASNGFPAGEKELPTDADALQGIQIVGPRGPEPAPTGALVQVIGCLEPEGNGWKLTSSTEPEVSTMDDVKADVKAAAGQPMGSLSVRLLDVFPKPDPHKGHKMLAKGLLIRQATDMQVNVMAMEMVAASCP